MRGGVCNDGAFRACATCVPHFPVRHFRTDGSVFSSPVIGRGETVYIGSADKSFYAFDPLLGREVWRVRLKELIDSAACIGPDGSVYVPAADGLYCFDARGNQRWRLDLLARNERFTPSTIYWWEGNVVLGPNGWLYAGCDDFHFYALDPQDGSVRWALRTGCCVWTAAAFGPDGTVFIGSFDRYLYALDQETGRIRWSTNLGNFLVSSPAVAADGTVFIGSFDGKLYALNGANGKVLWHVETGAPVYASPAIAADGLLFIGSSDGKIYCVDTGRRSIRWTFFTGDAVRSSAALGPDPEGVQPYLIYVGGGNGHIYALEPGGKRRWSYNTTAQSPAGPQYCNINASIAAGAHGIATASANGDVIYVPYNAYREFAGSPSFCSEPTDGFPREGAFLCPLSIGGLPAEPRHRAPIRVLPGETISLRPLRRKSGNTVRVRLHPRRIKIRRRDFFAHEVHCSPDGTQINIVPKGLPQPGTYQLNLRISLKGHDRRTERTHHMFRVEVAAPIHAPEIRAVPPLRITQMSVFDPPIVPSFDQIAIASLTIDARIVRADPAKGTVLGWGVQKFGFDAEGEPDVGIPQPRFFAFAFAGRYRDGALLLESRNCSYEITAFPVPLTKLRFTATVSHAGIRAGSMLMLAHIGLFAALRRAVRDAQLVTIGDAVRFVSRHAMRAWRYVRSWFPREPRIANAWDFLHACGQLAKLGWGMLLDRIWQPWGLLDRHGRFCGVGTFSALRPSIADHSGLRVRSFAYERRRRQVVLEFDADPSYRRCDAAPGILLYDQRTLQPLAIDYTRWLTTERTAGGIPVRAVLDIPPSVRLWGRSIQAIAFIDLEERAVLDLKRVHQLRRDSVASTARWLLRRLSWS